MRQRARALGYGVRRAFGGLRRYPATAAAVMATVAVAFFLVGLVYVIGTAIDATTTSWQRAHMVLYLEDGIEPSRADELLSTMRSAPAVQAAEYVSPELALERLDRSMAHGGGESIAADIEASMLPASIELTLEPGLREVAAMEPMIERLQAMSGVDEVAFAETWVDDVSAMRRAVKSAGTVAMLTVLLLALYLSVSALSARLGPRVREAAIARLFGASTSYVRLPLALEGALQGLLGATLAAFALWLFLAGIAPGARAAFGDAAGAALALPDALRITGFLAAGAALGFASSWLATRRHVAA